MATLALAVAGAAAGSALLPAGIGILGATISGATLGGQIGALAGSYIDQSLFGASGKSRPVRGPRLHDLHITSSTEGTPIPRLYGRARLGGQVIWADEIDEKTITRSSGSGTAKGGAAAVGGSGGEIIEYRYFASFAVALCEGEISGLGRLWADGREVDLSRIAHRLYTGSETQAPDSLIEGVLGAGNAPAFRGTAYIVFEKLPLRHYGNRIPQLSFEVYRSVEDAGAAIRGVVLIPGSGEFVYATEPVSRDYGFGHGESENVHTRQGATDWSVSMDQLAATLPGAKSVSLIVSWFGTDLRAGNCQLKPGVDIAIKDTSPITWQVAGVNRGSAHLISHSGGRPAYGGTPADDTVVAAIQDLKARGHDVTLTPFILMDVASGNALPNPYGGSSQPSYPWRGRITVHPAPGQPGTPDKTAAAATQIAAFVGTAAVSDFAISGTTVVYSGPSEWTLRRMVLHMAHLAKAAGGVEAFVIGSELKGLSQVRSGAGSYPFVGALQALAGDVKTVLGPATKITYAADWSEYFGHQPQDGSNDVCFHLDPLWASSSIDAIGIDLYWPLADWRDGKSHLDFLAGARSIYDLDYLKGNVAAGEGYAWYYASDSARASQTRSPITDGAGKPWVFRYKDLKSWWLNPHFDRPSGTESGTPTAWVPQSKPFWIMEVGCPAVDKGANQPNVFVDPKSAETALPHFSSGRRDDLMQRRYIRAFIEAFDPDAAGYVGGANPVSAITGQRMLDLDHVHVYAWDARPFPAFPYNTKVWGDGDNWRFGHWLNGRFASAPVAEAVTRLLADYGFAAHTVEPLNGTVAGYVVDRVMSARDALQPLELAYFFDSLESGGAIVFRPRGAAPEATTLTVDALVEDKPDAPLLTLTRGQETELPASAKLSYVDGALDYRQAVAEARRLAGASGRTAEAEVPIVLESDQAAETAESWLFEAWAARERASFTLPPSALALEPGDVVRLVDRGESRLVRITEIGEHGARDVEARSIDPEVYTGVLAPARRPEPAPPVLAGTPLVEFLDLPLLSETDAPQSGYVAALQTPWPGGVAVYASPETTGYLLRLVASAPAIVGLTLDSMPSGPVAVLDRAARVRVQVEGGELMSVTLPQLLAGQNAAAVRNEAGTWEMFQYQTATLVAPSTYELAGLLRGLGGTELAMCSSLAAGARVVFLDGAVARLDLTSAEIGLPLNWRCGPASRDIGDATYVTEAHTFLGVGQKPLSPAHVRGTRDAAGLTISWKRRTRLGGDSWEGADVPLSEESERYEVDILSGATVKRTLTSTSPSVLYSVAQQTADFGSQQPAYQIKVYQLGASFGRGSEKPATV